MMNCPGMFQTNSFGSHTLIISPFVLLDAECFLQIDNVVIVAGKKIKLTGWYSFDRAIVVNDGYETHVTNNMATKIAYAWAVGNYMGQKQFTNLLKEILSKVFGLEVEFEYNDIPLSSKADVRAIGSFLFRSPENLLNFVFSPASCLIITNDEVCPIRYPNKRRATRKRNGNKQ